MRERKGIFMETGNQGTSSGKVELGKKGNELEEEEGPGEWLSSGMTENKG